MSKKFYIGIFTLFLVLLATVMTCQAATITVFNKNDSGTGSLRQAITDSAAGDTINFAAGLKGSILLASQLIINKNLIINGAGANVLGVEGRTTPTESRVFDITAGNVRISDLRISRGFTSGAGGGVDVEGGSLTLNNCLIIGNSAESGGGAAVFTGSTLTITNSTIAGNDAASNGGGVQSQGGTLIMVNSTIYGNDGNTGGVSISNGAATILNCTITKNGHPFGFINGLSNFASSAVVNLKNTIVAQNIVSAAPLANLGLLSTDVGGVFNSQGNNLIGDSTSGSGFVASDLLNVNPQFGGFANNGGATYTVSLLAGSPAINAGNNTGAPATDQRGAARPQGATVDIGSYESGVRPQAFGKIAFVGIVGSNREIFSMNSDTTNQVNLTNNSARDDEPKWSADGSKIVFVSDRDSGLLEIYSMNANGSGVTRLTNNAVADENPVWSPDGSKIAFDRSGQIFVMNATDGTGVTQLTSGSFPGIKAHPSWSPDGTQIVFHNNRGFADFRVQVIASSCVNCTGGQTLVNNPPPDNFNPAWSPDGNTIAFSNDQLDFDDHSQPYTFLFSPFLGNLSFPARPLATTNNPRIFSPAWSPDGTKLIYQDSGDISTINADGSSPTLLGVEGLLPDWGGSNTPTGANISTTSGTTSITFSNILTPGTTTVVPIDSTTAGTLPGGYSLGANFPAYEISTTATFTAPITVCLQVPAVTNAMTFAALRILHNEGGTLVDRTILSPDTPTPNFATKTICARVNSLSPFVVANNAPTAASVAVSGRVKVSNGRGIHLARVSITDSNGETRTTLTDFFGFYRFDEILAGESYFISVRYKHYQFNSRFITVLEEIQDADFTAEPQLQEF